MDNDNIEKKIILSVDKAAADAGLRAIQNYDKGVNALGKSLKSVGKSAGDYADEVRLTIRANADAAQASVKWTKAIQEQDTEAKQTIGTLDKLKNKYAELKQSSSGGLGGQVNDIRGSLSAVGVSSPALEVAGGLSDAIQAFGTLNPLAITAALSIGAVSLAFEVLGKSSQEQVRQINSIVEARRSVNQSVVSGLTSDEAEARIASLQDSIAREQDLLADLQSGYTEVVNQFGGFVGRLIGGDLVTKIEESQASISGMTAEINQLNLELQGADIAANDTAQAEEELARTREIDAQKAIAQTEAANQRILALNEQRDSAIENRLIARSNAAQSSKLEGGFAEEDEKAELTKHLADLQSIRQSGFDKEKALAQDIADLPNQQAKDLALVTGKGTEQLNKLNNDYFQNQIKATKDFAKESGRINQEVAKNAKRIAEDLRDSLSDAARDNDVVAFLQAQRDGQKELRRNAEDAKDAEKQRQEDFLDQQAEQRQAFQQRQQEILRQVDEEKAKVLQSYAEKKAAIEQQIQQERVNTQQAIANAQARYQQEEQLENIQAQRNAERLKLRDAQENAAFQRQLSAIAAKTQAELAGLARIQAAASAMGSGMNKTAYGKPTSSYVSPYANIPTASSGGFGGKIGSSTVVVNQYNTVGDVATSSQVTAALKQQAQAVFGAMQGGISSAQGN